MAFAALSSCVLGCRAGHTSLVLMSIEHVRIARACVLRRESIRLMPFDIYRFAAVTRMDVVNRCEIVAVYNGRGEKLKLAKPVNINHHKVRQR